MAEYAFLSKYLSKNVQVVTEIVNNKKVMAKTPQEANLYGNWCFVDGIAYLAAGLLLSECSAFQPWKQKKSMFAQWKSCATAGAQVRWCADLHHRWVPVLQLLPLVKLVSIPASSSTGGTKKRKLACVTGQRVNDLGLARTHRGGKDLGTRQSRKMLSRGQTVQGAHGLLPKHFGKEWWTYLASCAWGGWYWHSFHQREQLQDGHSRVAQVRRALSFIRFFVAASDVSPFSSRCCWFCCFDIPVPYKSAVLLCLVHITTSNVTCLFSLSFMFVRHRYFLCAHSLNNQNSILLLVVVSLFVLPWPLDLGT